LKTFKIDNYKLRIIPEKLDAYNTFNFIAYGVNT